MNLSEMHIWFRQFVQQMGMQNTRAILPEQIDLVINTSITDITNQLIQAHIGLTNDRVITDNSKIGQTNAFGTLYKVDKVLVTDYFGNSEIEGDYKIYKASFTSLNIDWLFFTNLDINYIIDTKVTNYFPIRIIDDIYLADTLNDFILRPKLRSPIAVVNNKSINIYVDAQHNISNLEANQIRISYVAKPAKVQYRQDFGQPNIDCDLPEYLHIDILKHAADLWRIAITGALNSANQQNQVNQQEAARNNYRTGDNS